jgi:rubrerythrin
MSEREGEKSSYGRIQAKKTLREVLEVAISFEQSAQAFYSDLIPKVSKNLRWLV